LHSFSQEQKGSGFFELGAVLNGGVNTRTVS